MEDHKMTESSEDLSPDEDSRLGRGAFSAGAQGICAIQPPNQYPPEVWAELCRQGKLRHSGHGLFELPRAK
ncbi:MAG: hypothetical protein ACYSOU_01885 [Planctomycetota bacterium]|jgi:hypothetical protein